MWRNGCFQALLGVYGAVVFAVTARTTYSEFFESKYSCELKEYLE